MPVTVHGFGFSTYTRSALLVLAEKGVPYVLVPARLRDPAYAGLHPWLKMPVLDHDGFVLYEAAAVLRYVDEAFDGPALQPDDVRARARMTQWISAFNDYVAPNAVRGVLIPRFVLAPRGTPVDDAAIARKAGLAHDALGRFEAALAESPYLAGPAPTLADWLLLPVLAADPALPAGEHYAEGHPRLADWTRRMQARPSWTATSPA